MKTALARLAKICRDNIVACESGKRRSGRWTAAGVQGELAGVISTNREVLSEIKAIRRQNRKAGGK